MVASDVELLRRAVVENPYDDAPRLIYADALDERGNPGDAARAEFVRLQVEQHRLGPPRLQIDAIPTPRGDDYMEVVTGTIPSLSVGARVDVAAPTRARDRRETRRYYGWRVTKILPDDPALETVRVALRRDEHSKPYPYRDAKRLGLRVRDLWANSRWDTWFECPFPEPTADDEIRHYVGRLPYAAWHADHHPAVMVFHHAENLEYDHHSYVAHLPYSLNAAWRFERGFVSHVSCRWSHWALWGDLLTKHEPVCRVKLVTHPAPDTVAGTSLAGKPLHGKAWDVFAQNHPNFPRSWGELLSWRWPSIRPDSWELPPPVGSAM